MTFEESWEAADQTCFDRLKLSIGSGDRVGKAYHGYLPESMPNCWMFTSGGNAETDLGRFKADTPLLCVLRFNALMIGRYVKREDAMRWSMRAYQFFRDTNNLHNVENVQWLCMAGAPDAPILEPQVNGSQLWVVTIPLEMIFATETTY